MHTISRELPRLPQRRSPHQMSQKPWILGCVILTTTYRYIPQRECPMNDTHLMPPIPGMLGMGADGSADMSRIMRCWGVSPPPSAAPPSSRWAAAPLGALVRVERAPGVGEGHGAWAQVHGYHGSHVPAWQAYALSIRSSVQYERCAWPLRSAHLAGLLPGQHSAEPAHFPVSLLISKAAAPAGTRRAPSASVV